MLEDDSSRCDVNQKNCVEVDMDALVAYNQGVAFFTFVLLEVVQTCIVDFKLVLPLNDIPWTLHLI